MEIASDDGEGLRVWGRFMVLVGGETKGGGWFEVSLGESGDDERWRVRQRYVCWV